MAVKPTDRPLRCHGKYRSSLCHRDLLQDKYKPWGSHHCFQPFDAHWYHMGTAIKHPVPDCVKLSLVIFDIRAELSARMAKW